MRSRYSGEGSSGPSWSTLLAGGSATMMEPSQIRHLAERAWARPDAIRLELGEPGTATPQHVVEAADRAAQQGATTYTPNGGIPSLRAALAEKVTRVNGFAAESDQIIVGAGAVQVLFVTLTTLVRPGDEVLVPDPSWPNYRMMCDLLGVRAVGYPLEESRGFLPDPEQIDSLVGPRTRALLLNSPSNPLGVVHDPTLTTKLLELCHERGLWVISDECYDELVYEGEHVSAAAVASADQRDLVISIFSFSKVHAMTGWRVGYGVLPPAIAPTVVAAQEPLISCVNTPAQHAALAAVSGPQDHVEEMKAAFRRRRDLVGDALDSAGIANHRPPATFYVWLPTGVSDSMRWALDLLDEHGVAVAPGRAFGPAGEGYIRINLGLDDSKLLEGVDRIVTKLRIDDLEGKQ